MNRVLAVDDNPRNLAIIEKTVAGEFQIVTATSGEEALEVAPRYHPDLILLDIMMPGIDGYETCRRLRATPALATTKIIMVSARTTTADRLEGYAAGANDYVTKPFDPDELLAKLRVYLRLKSVEEVDRLKSDLLSLLSHETRTPLNAILSPAALLLDDPTLTAEQRGFVEMIQTGGFRFLELVEKVMFLSQLKADMVPGSADVLDAEAVVTGAIATARRRVARADVAVEIRVDDVLRIEGDAPQLECALQAVIDNALRVSPPSGVVRVHVGNSGPWTVFAVTDQGPGIAPGFIEHVFDLFAVESVRHHGRGHGLSLATAQLIVERHGGLIGVESEPGHGATFRIALPARTVGELAA